ncbi:MAG TPA: ROK family protein [Hyphomicrobiaceae bacterium]|jgi:polyphosphate glucokinase
MSTAIANVSAPQAAPAASGPFTLAVDIGGTNIKASVLDAVGQLAAQQIRSPTPKPATPQAVLDLIGQLAAQLPAFQRISVGFPGVVRGGQIVTAPNLGTPHWAGCQLIDALAERFGTPARVLNDAAVQGLGVVEGLGLECVLTLGTGVGCALFRNRRLLLHVELGQHRMRRGKTYDQYIGQAALAKRGSERWNKRVRKAISTVTNLTSCDVLYVGGGNARKLTLKVPAHVRIVSNTAGITGGIRLWEAELDELFQGVAMAQVREAARQT